LPFAPAAGGPIKQVQKSAATNRDLTGLTLRFTRLSTTSREKRSKTFDFLETRRDAQKSQNASPAPRHDGASIIFRCQRARRRAYTRRRAHHSEAGGQFLQGARTFLALSLECELCTSLIFYVSCQWRRHEAFRLRKMRRNSLSHLIVAQCVGVDIADRNCRFFNPADGLVQSD
jgi:hypothetical protein